MLTVSSCDTTVSAPPDHPQGVSSLNRSKPAQETALEYRRQRVMRLLRETSEAVDSLWQATVAQSLEDDSVELGEASHAIHRALVSLSGD